MELQNAEKEKERKEEREAKETEQLREWFEKYAIEACVDPLLAQVLFLQDFLVRRATDNQTGLTTVDANIPAPPYEAYIRIFVITGAANFPMLCGMARAGLVSNISIQECQKYMKSLNLVRIVLIRLRQYLMTTQVTTKSDIHSLCNVPRIQKLGNLIDQQIEAMFTGQDSNEISPLTAMLRKMASQIPDE